MLQRGWRKALRAGCAGTLIKRPGAAGVFSALVVSVSGKGGNYRHVRPGQLSASKLTDEATKS